MAQASVTVSVLDPVYRDIDKLVPHDLVDVVIRGQRPYSRTGIARITAEALAKLPRFQPELTSVRRILTGLHRDYAEELALSFEHGDNTRTQCSFRPWNHRPSMNSRSSSSSWSMCGA